MTIVLDASIVLAWLVDEERDPAAVDVLTLVTRSGAIVPAHWRLEVANALSMSVRRGRIDLRTRNACLVDLAALDIRIDEFTSGSAWMDTLALADRHRLTVYDAAYLELALRRGLPLATLDRALGDAARGSGVGVRP